MTTRSKRRRYDDHICHLPRFPEQQFDPSLQSREQHDGDGSQGACLPRLVYDHHTVTFNDVLTNAKPTRQRSVRPYMTRARSNLCTCTMNAVAGQ